MPGLRAGRKELALVSDRHVSKYFDTLVIYPHQQIEQIVAQMPYRHLIMHTLSTDATGMRHEGNGVGVELEWAVGTRKWVELGGWSEYRWGEGVGGGVK